MKKVLSLFFVALFGMMFVIPIFPFELNVKTNALSKNIESQDIKNKYEILNPLDGSYLGSVEKKNPFDLDKEEMMPGFSIEPNEDEFGQVNVEFNVAEFSILDNQSIFMWIFLPEKKLNNLEIELVGTNNEKIVWNILAGDLYGLCVQNIFNLEVRGWRLFEFASNVATKSLNGKNLNEIQFNRILLKYIDSENKINKVTVDSFAIYDVFVADSISNNIFVLQKRSLINYKTNNVFKKKFENLYKFDEFSFNSVRECFDYLIVGRDDLKNSYNNYYKFETKISTPKERNVFVDIDEKYIFDTIGECSFSIDILKLTKDENGENQYLTVFSNQSKVIFKFEVKQFFMGSFSNYNFEIDKGKTKVVYFNLNGDFVFDSELKVKVKDPNIATIEYKIENKTCEIKIKGTGKGRTKIDISAIGHRRGTTEKELYTAQMRFLVNAKNDNKFELIILWVTLGVYLIGFLIYVIISIIKSKKSGVR